MRMKKKYDVCRRCRELVRHEIHPDTMIRKTYPEVTWLPLCKVGKTRTDVRSLSKRERDGLPVNARRIFECTGVSDDCSATEYAVMRALKEL